MKLKINKACDLASISVLPPRRPRASGGGGTGASASAAASQQRSQSMSQQRSQSMSQQSFSQGGGAPFSQGVGSGGASFSQGRGGSGALFSQGSGSGSAAFSQVGGGGAAFSQGGGSGGSAFSLGGGSGGAAFSQGGGGGAAFSQGAGAGGASFSQGGGGGGAPFSQGGGGGGASISQGGGSSSLLHSQSQISQASLDENLLSLLRPSPARNQRFALHDDSSKKMSSFPANSASCVREESQLQLAKIPSSPNHRWNPSLPDSRCQVNEDVERKFQHVASSVHKMGMVLDSVQNDVMQLNRAMKEASLDSGSIQKKFVLVENSLQQILKGQDDLKELLLGSTKGNPDQMSVLNSHTSKLDELSSTLSVLNQVQEEMRQLKGDIFKIFTKEMEGVVRAIRSLSSKPDAIHTLADQSCTTNENLLMNQTPEADGRPQKKQTPVANVKPQKKQTPVAKGRPQKKQTAVPNEKPQRKQTTVAKGRPRKKQAPVPDGKPQMKQTPAANGRPQMKHAQIAHGISKMNQVAEANGKPPMKQIAAAEVIPAPQVYGRKVEALKAKVEEGKVVKAGAQNLAGSSCCMVAPKQEELGIQKVNPQALTTKVLIIDLDDDEEEGSDGSDTCVEPGLQVGLLTNGEEVSEDAVEILRRARKRRRREATWDIVLVHE